MLNPGSKLGPYEIVGAIGAGGMGEVYRARDTRLDRTVAIKILPQHLTAKSNVKQRFEREARAISSLQHPNICTLYDVGHQDATDFLVMEFLEGETLADRLAKGPLPPEQVLKIGIEICEGLEKAHRTGVVHRDLKPGNIMLTKTGTKLLDFGLAKPLEVAPVASMTALPTSSKAMEAAKPVTAEGTIVGTFQYMSPEQLEGKEADERSDIFALGAVLYEMATGRRAFEGKSQTSVIAAILEREPPPISSLQPMSPPAMDRVVKLCLAKDPDERIQSAHDVKLQLEWIRDAGTQAGVPAPVAARRKLHERFWIATITLMAIAATLATIGYLLRAPLHAEAVVAQIAPPDNANFSLWGVGAGAPALSPDGTQLAFVARTADGRDLLFVRPLNSATAQPLDRTDGASFPFWSPDSRSLAYFAKTEIYRIDVSGGPPVAIGAVGRAAGAAWGGDSTILLGATIATSDEMQRIPVSGGKAEPVGKFGLLRQFWWPQFLPDGKRFLFYAASSESSEDAGTYVAALSGGEPKLILPGSSAAVYAPPGYLLFVRDGALMAQHFDARNLSLASQAMPLAENLGVNLVSRRGIFTVSENGTLVYETATPEASRILWYDRSGKQIDETATSTDLGTPSISPDGRKLALSDGSAGKPDVWVYDLARGIKTRITSSPGINGDALWSPDGTKVCFVSNRDGRFHLYQEAADGTGKATPLTTEDAAVAEFFGSWTADGRYLAFQRSIGARVPSDNGPASGEVWALPLFGDRKPFPVVQNGEFVAIQPALSPDGRWLAYVSDESGTDQIHIVPFPHGGGKWQVSSTGGSWPKWRRDGKELFFRAPDDKIVSVEIAEQGGNLIIGKTQALFQANPALGGLGAMYDVSADGKKFVVVSRVQKSYPPLTLVTNWPALLKR